MGLDGFKEGLHKAGVTVGAKVFPDRTKGNLTRAGITMTTSIGLAQTGEGPFARVQKIADGSDRAPAIVDFTVGVFERMKGMCHESALQAAALNNPELSQRFTDVAARVDDMVAAIRSGAYETVDEKRTEVEKAVGEAVWLLGTL